MPPHRKNRGTAVEKVADKFGGMADLARAIGLDPSAVRHWQTTGGGTIPRKRHAAIMDAAKAAHVRVSRKDLGCI